MAIRLGVFGINTCVLLLLLIIVGLNAEDPNHAAKKSTKEREADEFAHEYMEVIGHEANLTWAISKDFEAVPVKRFFKFGESENCSGLIKLKPLCIICSHAINKTILKVEPTAKPESAHFQKGKLVFPYSSDFEEKYIDVLLCNHSPKVAGREHFYLTRSKYAESVYGLDKVGDGDAKNDDRPTFTLNGKWIDWYNEDLTNHNFQISQL